jgi:hypothetical protein
MFQKLDLFPSSGEVRETPTLLGPLERANLNHWYRSSFHNAVLSSSVEFRTMNKVQKPRDYDIYIVYKMHIQWNNLVSHVV